MTWTDRLNRAVEARAFRNDDVIAAFSRDTGPLAECGFPVDQHGQALDGFAQRFADEMGWKILSNDVAGALRAFQALHERAAMVKGELAA